MLDFILEILVMAWVPVFIAGIVFKIIAFVMKKRTVPAFPDDFRKTDTDERFVWICRKCREEVGRNDMQCPHCSGLKFDRVTREKLTKETRYGTIGNVLLFAALIIFLAAFVLSSVQVSLSEL